MNTSNGFELHGLQKLFVTSLGTVQEPKFLFHPEVIREYVIGEVARIKHRFLEKAITIEGEDVLRRYVQAHQYALVRIMDKLFERSSEPAFVACYAELNGLLVFMKEYFSRYIDDSAKAPLGDIEAVRKEALASHSYLKKKLEENCVAPQLVHLTLDPLTRFCWTAVKTGRISFSRLRHTRYILEQTKMIANKGYKRVEVDRKLIELMIYLNYNSRKTFSESTALVEASLAAINRVEIKIIYLSRLLMNVNQSPVKPGTGYHLHIPTLKCQLAEFLDAQLVYFRGIIDLQLAAEQTKPEKEYKIKLNLTVAQLGCVMRVCADAGYISVENTSELMRFLACHCETKKAERISEKSLRTKFYDIQEETQRAVKQILSKMVATMEGWVAAR